MPTAWPASTWFRRWCSTRTICLRRWRWPSRRRNEWRSRRWWQQVPCVTSPTCWLHAVETGSPCYRPTSVNTSFGYKSTWYKGKGKVDHAPQESVGGCLSPSSGPWSLRWRTINVCDAWPVRRQTYGYLPSCCWSQVQHLTATPLSHIYCRVWTTCHVGYTVIYFSTHEPKATSNWICTRLKRDPRQQTYCVTKLILILFDHVTSSFGLSAPKNSEDLYNQDAMFGAQPDLQLS